MGIPIDTVGSYPRGSLAEIWNWPLQAEGREGGGRHSRWQVAGVMSQGTYIRGFMGWTQVEYIPATALQNLKVYTVVLMGFSHRYPTMVVSTPHSYLQAVSLKMAPTVGIDGKNYIPRTEGRWGASSCQGLGRWSTCGHVLSMTSSNKYPEKHLHTDEERKVMAGGVCTYNKLKCKWGRCNICPEDSLWYIQYFLEGPDRMGFLCSSIRGWCGNAAGVPGGACWGISYFPQSFPISSETQRWGSCTHSGYESWGKKLRFPVLWTSLWYCWGT